MASHGSRRGLLSAAATRLAKPSRPRLTPMGRCPELCWCAALGLQLLSPPGPAHGDRETSVIEKRTPGFRHRHRIQRGGDHGCGKDADRKTGDPR